MSRIYDNWEKLVGAVLKREELRRLALCESFSSSNFSSRPSFDSTGGHQLLSWETRVQVAIGAARGLSFFHDSAIMVTHEGIDGQMDQAGWSRLSVLGTVDPSNQSISGLHNAMAIQLKVIERATRNFRPDLLLGEGRSGPVKIFKGVIDEHPLTTVKLESGIVVAVSKLNLERVVGRQQCLKEIQCLSKLRHPNLVRLIGYCFEADNKILVYEFVPCGSLDYHLFGGPYESHLEFQLITWSLAAS